MLFSGVAFLICWSTEASFKHPMSVMTKVTEDRSGDVIGYGKDFILVINSSVD